VRYGRSCGTAGIGADGRPTRPAYAPGAYPKESADPACDFRHDGTDGFWLLSMPFWRANAIPVELAKLRDTHIKARPEVIQKSLVGNGSRSICSRCSRRGGCMQSTNSSSRSALPRSNGGWEGLSHGLMGRPSHCPRTARRAGTMPRRERSAPRRSPPAREFDLRTEVYKAVRRGRDADPRLGVPGSTVVQRDGP